MRMHQSFFHCIMSLARKQQCKSSKSYLFRQGIYCETGKQPSSLHVQMPQPDGRHRQPQHLWSSLCIVQHRYDIKAQEIEEGRRDKKMRKALWDERGTVILWKQSLFCAALSSATLPTSHINKHWPTSKKHYWKLSKGEILSIYVRRVSFCDCR